MLSCLHSRGSSSNNSSGSSGSSSSSSSSGSSVLLQPARTHRIPLPPAQAPAPPPANIAADQLRDPSTSPDAEAKLPSSRAAIPRLRAAAMQAWNEALHPDAPGRRKARVPQLLDQLVALPPQAPRSGQAATQPAASEPGPSTPLPAKRSKRTKAEPEAAEPTKGKGKGKAAKAKPAPQPGRWLDRDCNAALYMQRIGESRWRPLELCYWPDQGALPAKGKEYPGLGYKRLRDKPPKAQEQQQQPAAAQ
ncbi:hypothetical protein QJQ45_011243 [Haematococcus lacustris]|nr:hypothetical protein QJQ45_011243 [Haematococcus lacustris]